MNPELRRNLSLEITPQRLLAMPSILALLFTGAWLLDGHRFATFTISATIIAYLLIAIVWGSRRVAESLSDELDQGTWDGQRVSGLSARAMVWGKLLGGGAFTWYGGGLCLLVYVCATWKILAPATVGLILVTLLSLTLAALATSLLSTLALWRKLRSPHVGNTRAVYAVLLLLVFFMHGFGALHQLTTGQVPPVTWYGHRLPGLPFYALSSLVFAGWALLGVYRLMRAELQYRNGPLIWITFLLFLTAYFGGWLYGSATATNYLPLFPIKLSPTLLQLALGGVLCSSLVYLTVFYERKDGLRLQRLAQLWGRDKPRALQDFPLWLSSLVLTFIFAVVFCVMALLQLPLSDNIAVLAGTANLLCFLLRDLLLILWLNATPIPRRADAAAILYLAVLYLLLPALMVVAHLPALANLFNPVAAFSQPVWLAAGVFELAAMLDLTRRRRHSMQQARLTR